jgi:hypothetical protein
MEDGVIEELGFSFVTIFIKMLYWYFVNYILLSIMGFQDKYIIVIGYQCYIMYYGQLGHLYLHLFLRE